MALVERPLEAVEDVVDLLEARFLELEAGGDRALPAATDQHDRSIHARDLLHLTDEVRIDLPVGALVPGDVMGTRGVPDEQIFDLAAAIDEHRIGVVAQEVEGFAGCKVLHAGRGGEGRGEKLDRDGAAVRGVDAKIDEDFRPLRTLTRSAPYAQPMQADHTAELARLLAGRILVLDGAWGTMIQQQHLTEADFRGPAACGLHGHHGDLKGDNDLLALTRPDVVAAIHDAYFDAGADITETNTFNATSIAQSDYGLQSRVREINLAAARIARARADDWTARTPDKPRYVAGSLGPTNRTASISPKVDDPGARNVSWDELRVAYFEAADALIEGGVDILLVETVFDTLNAKAALFAIEDAFDRHGGRLPVIVSGTVTDASGRTLSGQTPEAFWNSVRHARPLAVGLNCALGAALMRPYIEELARVADTFICCYPNAGLPNPMSDTGYDETPDVTSQLLGEFARSGLVNLVGGCCGTTPAHIRAIAAAVAGVVPRRLHDREAERLVA